MGGGTAHFGRRGKKPPKLKKKWLKNLWTSRHGAQGTLNGGAKGPQGMPQGHRGAAPFVSYWWKYAFYEVETLFPHSNLQMHQRHRPSRSNGANKTG